jgi:hypothetical protein
MAKGKGIVCIQCGHSVGDPPVLNEMPEGGNCPACAERLLETLPPIFHSPFEAPDEAAVPEEHGEYEHGEDGYPGYDGGESA